MLPFLKRVYVGGLNVPPYTIHLLTTFSTHTDTVVGAYLWQMCLLETVPAKTEIAYGKDANTDYPREREADRRDTGQTCQKSGFP